MSEIKVGGQVAIGPFVVKRDSTVVSRCPQFAAAIREDSDAAMWMDGFHPDDAIPWHPALPALARWLSEHPEANAPECVVMLRSDAAALVNAIESARVHVDRIHRGEAERNPIAAILIFGELSDAIKSITPEVLARAEEATR